MTFPPKPSREFLDTSAATPWKVLDVAAGHGVFGITSARHNPNAEIYALDWETVLTVARDNAQQSWRRLSFPRNSRHAFHVNPGSGYDLILITNFLHHFDAPSVEALLRKFHAALAAPWPRRHPRFHPRRKSRHPARHRRLRHHHAQHHSRRRRLRFLGI